MTALALEDASDLLGCYRQLVPTSRPRMLLWCIDHIQNDIGQPYDHFSYPHLGAPGGPFDALDDHIVRELVLQFGSRLGKTFVGQCRTIYNGTVLRLPQITVSSKEKLAMQVHERTAKMIAGVKELDSAMAKPRAMRTMSLLEFVGATGYLGWARSAATLADKDCVACHCNELDDWDQLTTSKDGDPLDQALERLKNHWGERKAILESIPKIKGKSRIEAARLRGWNCEFHVPCPLCQRYQVVEMGTRDTDYGVKWERDERLTAWYQCRHCHERMDDHHRPQMMRGGVWIPEGCEVDHEAALEVNPLSSDYEWRGWKHANWVTGSPVRNNEIASHRLASYCSLKLTWADIASAFLGTKDRPQKLRNYVNQWDARTWEARKSRSEPEQIAIRLNNGLPRGIVPEWGRVVVVACDRQARDGGLVPFAVVAGGERGESAVIDYGVEHTLGDVWNRFVLRTYHAADGGEPFVAEAMGIDSGWDPATTYQFCQTHSSCVPIKGANTDVGTGLSRWSDSGTGKHDTGGMSLLMINTDLSEDDMQRRLDESLPNEASNLELCLDATRDMDLLTQLCNAAKADLLDRRGGAKLLWVKKSEDTPNDYRDAVRYANALIEAFANERFEQGVRVWERNRPRHMLVAVAPTTSV